MKTNKNKKSVKFQGDMLNFCDFIQVFVFTRNHHLNIGILLYFEQGNLTLKNNIDSSVRSRCVVLFILVRVFNLDSDIFHLICQIPEEF